MGGIAAALIIFATSSTDICANPVEADYPNPPLCLLESAIQVVTPYYAINVDADLYVGVGAGGAGVMIQELPWDQQLQMKVGLQIGSWEETLGPMLDYCSDYPLNGAVGLRCDLRLADGNIFREYFFDGGMTSSTGEDLTIHVRLTFPPDGHPFLPRFESMLESLEIRESRQIQG